MSQRVGNRLGFIGLLWVCSIAASLAFVSKPSSLSPQRYPTTLNAQQEPLEAQQSLLQEQIDNDSNFLRNCQVDSTITNLRQQLPQLLLKPLSEDDVNLVYSDDITLVGPNGEELADGHEELVSLSSTLVAATAAARQANAFASSFTALGNPSSSNDTVVCEMVMDESIQTLRVKWKVELPIVGPQAVSELVGLSDLILDPDSGIVSQHVVLDIRLDGNEVSAVGETLATLRRAVKTFGGSPFLTGLRESPLAATLLTDIRNGLLQQQESTLTNETALPLPPLYVADTISSAFEETNSDDNGNNMTLIDDLPTTSPPLPGSRRWKSFAASRQAIAQFVEYGLPILSGKGFSTRDDFEQLFASDAVIKGVDGTTVLTTGGDRIANFYQTMASLRKSSSSDDWKIVQVSTDYSTRSVIVNWVASSPIRVEGKDRFQLKAQEGEPVIQSIQQLELKISGNRVNDPEWFRTFLTAIESGRSNVVGVDMVVELLQQAGGSQPRITKSALKGPPKLNTEAAASFYGILRAFHRDLPTLTDANPQSPPAAEYVAENIELRGYLDEVLAKGSASYSQVANVLTASLRTALLSGRVTAESVPSPRVEVTPDGCIRVLLNVNLKVKVTPGDSDLGVPLKLELVSEYKVNSEGKIREHKLVESRVNGQLTPGDVMSRWIKGTTTSSSKNEPNLSFLDVLAWARSFSGNNKRQ